MWVALASKDGYQSWKRQVIWFKYSWQLQVESSVILMKQSFAFSRYEPLISTQKNCWSRHEFFITTFQEIDCRLFASPRILLYSHSVDHKPLYTQDDT